MDNPKYLEYPEFPEYPENPEPSENPPKQHPPSGAGGAACGLFILQFQIVVAEVLAVGRQLMVDQRGQYLLQLEEEPFARLIVVRPHVELNGESTSYLFHLTSYIIGEERGGGDGDGLVASREHSPAVGRAFGDPKRVAGLQAVQYGQVVDAALGALRKAEAGQGTTHEVAILDAHQLAFLIIIRYLQPGHALTVFP